MYGQIEDPANPGLYESFTCTTEWNRSSKTKKAKKQYVKSFSGKTSMNYKANRYYKWNGIARSEELFNDEALWTLSSGKKEDDYKSKYYNSDKNK